ncbi:putative transcription termination factor, mTERF [Ixodes scapularis]
MSSVSAIRGVLLGCSTRSLRRSCQLPIASRCSAPCLLQQLPRKFSNSSGPQKETTAASQIGGHDYFKSFYYGSHGASELQPTVAGQSPAVVDIPEDALDDDLTPFQEQLASEPNPDALSTEVDPEFLDEVGPGLHRSFNLAAYVNQSETLQKFLQLGVDLSRFDRRPGVPQMILALDFEKDVKPVIRFLTSLGVEPDRLGYIFTKNPRILKEQLENLQVRVDYLLSKKFTKEQVGRIASNAPFFLMFSVRRMDRRLGYLQKTFELTGDEVRHVVARLPKLPTCSIYLISVSRHQHS